MNNGFIVIWRKFEETWFYKDSYAVHLALHLIMKANHETTKFVFNKQPMELVRGQCIVGRHKLALETGIAPSTIRNKLELLKNVGFLDIKSDSKFSIVTICKYSDYQDKKEHIGQQLGQPEDSQRTARGHIQQLNNDNNNTKDYPFLLNEAFKNIFQAYLDMRVKIKKPATDKAKELVLTKLHKYPLEIAIKMLENSIVGSWQGIFEIKDQIKQQPQRGRLP